MAKKAQVSHGGLVQLAYQLSAVRLHVGAGADVFKREADAPLRLADDLQRRCHGVSERGRQLERVAVSASMEHALDELGEAIGNRSLLDRPGGLMRVEHAAHIGGLAAEDRGGGALHG